jgi:hypothetical protein
VRLRQKAERRTKLVLVVAAIRQTLGLRIQLPCSTSGTGTQSAGTFWWGEAASTTPRAHRHSRRHRWRAELQPEARSLLIRRNGLATATRLMAVFHPTMASQ